MFVDDEVYSGSFEFNYRGKVQPGGDFKSTITILPGTGTGELTGLHGVLNEDAAENSNEKKKKKVRG